MKLNEKTLIQYRNTEQTPDMEGILYKSEANKGFQKRWFTLRGNLLFYAEKKNDKEPIGVIIVEGCTIELAEEETEHFVFKLVFNDGVYCLGASSQLELEKWMKVLACASYDFMKLMVVELEHKVKQLDIHKSVPDAAATPPPIPPRAHRSNPFSSNSKAQPTSWTDLHTHIGKKIMQDREQWLASQTVDRS